MIGLILASVLGSGPTLPAVCTPGDFWYQDNTRFWFACPVKNTWAQTGFSPGTGTSPTDVLSGLLNHIPSPPSPYDGTKFLKSDLTWVAGGASGAPDTAEYVTGIDDAGLSADIFPSAKDQIPVSLAGPTAVWVAMPDCDDTGGQHLNYDDTGGAGPAFTCGSTGSGGSTPTGTGYRHVTAGVEDAASDTVTFANASEVQANQGTTVTVLHGNAAGQPAFSSVVFADTTGIAPNDAEYIVSEATANLSAEVAPSAANQVPVSSSSTAASWTTVPDAALTSNYSGVGACGAGAGVVATVDNAAPTCSANVMFDNEATTYTGSALNFSDGAGDSPQVIFTPQTGTQWMIYAEDASDDFLILANSAITEQVTIANTGAGVVNVNIDGTSASTNYPAGAVDDQVLVADSATTSTWKTIPNCVSNNMLTYTQATNTFGCDADDGGGGGGNSVEVSLAITGGSGIFTTSVTGQAWVAAGSEINCSTFGTTADGGTPELAAIAGFTVSVSDRVAGDGFTLRVYSPNGADGTFRFHCLGV